VSTARYEPNIKCMYGNFRRLRDKTHTKQGYDKTTWSGLIWLEKRITGGLMYENERWRGTA